MKSLERNPGTSFIDLARLILLYIILYGMITENNAKVLISKYRRRERGMWSNEDKINNSMFLKRRHLFFFDFKL